MHELFAALVRGIRAAIFYGNAIPSETRIEVLVHRMRLFGDMHPEHRDELFRFAEQLEVEILRSKFGEPNLISVIRAYSRAHRRFLELTAS